MHKANTSGQQSHTNPKLHGAFIIDEKTGREQPITEAMVQQACEQLSHQWRFPEKVS